MASNKNVKPRAKSTNYPRRSNKNSSTTVKKATTRSSDKIKKQYDSSSSNNERALGRSTHTRAAYRSYREPEYKKRNIKTKKDYKSNFKISALITLAIMLILSFVLTGLEFTVLIAIGLAIILGFSYLLHILMKRKWAKRFLNLIIILMVILILGIVSFGIYFFYTIVSEAPDFDVKKLKLKESTLIYDNKGQLIIELGTEKREIIKYEDLSEELINAIIATEDSRFFQHQGFDAARFAKASMGQLSGNENAGGGSTISMQVIKNSFTSKESKGFAGIKRKFTDIYLSIFKLEKQFTKQEIIEFYVNNHFLGSNTYGVEQASITYFGKKASQLNLSEAAIIAGMFQAPSSYNPFNYPESTRKRRAEVLSLMRRHGYINKEEEALANSIPITSLITEKRGETIIFGAYVDTVVEELEAMGYKPYNESLLIYTNMDRDRQQKMDDIFSGKTFNWVLPEVQSGIAAVDVNNGKILAIGAGRDRNDARQYNYATMIKRQIGSSAKPLFDYGPGLEYNNWSTYKLFYDGPYQYSSGQTIRNSDGGYRGTITLRTALAYSRNIPALKAFQQVDNKKIIEFVTNLGITPEIANGQIHEAHSLGAFNGASPLQMAAAYAAFANGGTYYKPYAVNKIVNRQTNEIKDFSSTGARVMSDSTAFMISDVLKTSVISGLSGAAKVPGINVAAKTGTTNFDKITERKYGLPGNAVHDAWVVGYDPDVALAMWYGYAKIDKTHYLTTNTAGAQRARVYQAVGRAMFKSQGKDFKVPDSVVRIPIEMNSDPASLASGGTPSWEVVYEWFKKGTEPTEVSAKYNKLANVSGLKVDYDSGSKTTSLSWSPVGKPSDAKEEYGPFGYKVYKDGRFLGFTENNSYTIRNDQSPTGSYRVVTTFEIYGANASSGVTVSIDNVEVSFSPSIKTVFNSGDTAYKFSDDVIAKRDGKSIPTTSNVSVKDPLTNNNVSWVTALTVPGKYVITYSVYNEGKQIGTLSREVEVK